MISERYYQIIFLALMVALMGSVISLVMTIINHGLNTGFFIVWGRSFLGSAAIAAPTAFFLGPVVQKLAKKIASKPVIYAGD